MRVFILLLTVHDSHHKALPTRCYKLFLVSMLICLFVRLFYLFFFNKVFLSYSVIIIIPHYPYYPSSSLSIIIIIHYHHITSYWRNLGYERQGRGGGENIKKSTVIGKNNYDIINETNNDEYENDKYDDNDNNSIDNKVIITLNGTILI